MRARRMRITLYPDGKLIVTVPFRMDQQRAKTFILNQSAWVVRQLDRIKSLKRIPQAPLHTKADILRLTEQACTLAHERIAFFNAHYGFPFNRISIRNQKTRWGSCSKKRNLNFNYRIAILPQRLSDYIIVHELCHLAELNHSLAFWNLVAKTFPDHKNIRRELRANLISPTRQI